MAACTTLRRSFGSCLSWETTLLMAFSVLPSTSCRASETNDPSVMVSSIFWAASLIVVLSWIRQRERQFGLGVERRLSGLSRREWIKMREAHALWLVLRSKAREALRIFKGLLELRHLLLIRISPV